MKTIVISDIYGDYESIIPYALNLAKSVNDKVEIIHTVDTRNHPAVGSAYSDSQSFEVGKKLSSEKIIQREISKAHASLDSLLSHEASRLNYPLRASTLVTEKELQKVMDDKIKHDRSTFIMASAIPDGVVVDDLNEIIGLKTGDNSYAMFIPPGLKFRKPNKAFVLYDFNSNNNQNIFMLLSFLSRFYLTIDVTAVAKKSDYIEMEMKSGLWKQIAQNYHGDNLLIQTNILEGDEIVKTSMNYIERNHFDMAVIPQEISGINSSAMLSKNISKQFIEKLNIPVLIY